MVIGYVMAYREYKDTVYQLEKYEAETSPKNPQWWLTHPMGAVLKDDVAVATKVLRDSPSLMLVNTPIALDDEGIMEDRMQRWIKWANEGHKEFVDAMSADSKLDDAYNDSLERVIC